MNRTRNLIAFGLILLVGLLGIGAYKLVSGWLFERGLTASSDSKVNATIRVGGDGYLGYFFMNSPEMKRQAAKRGLGIDFTDDKGAYADRLDKFAKGDYDAIVLPINSYVQHGFKHNYPGVIVAAISDSKGADAILCNASKLPTGKVSDLNDASLKIVYTGQSPTEFLLDLTIVDFDLFNLEKNNGWRQEVASSEEAYERAKKGQGDCFGMWEPQVSKALRDVPSLKKVWGSDGFRGYITDVFVFRRDYVSGHADEMKAFFESYFTAMRSYANDRDKMIDDMKLWTGLKQAEIEPMLDKIDWFDLTENAGREFGLDTGAGAERTEGVLNTVIATTNVLVKTGRLTKDPLTDPYKIINSTILQQVFSRLPAELGRTTKRTWKKLDDWSKLRSIGTMRVEPISFQQGSAVLDQAGEAQVDKIAEMLNNNYPDARVIIKGHTSPGSDEQESIKLSQERAEAVLQRLMAVHGIAPERFKAIGKGSSEPPPMRPGDNPRTRMYRLPRVEFDLYAENSF